jgi:hypothetical protein
MALAAEGLHDEQRDELAALTGGDATIIATTTNSLSIWPPLGADFFIYTRDDTALPPN